VGIINQMLTLNSTQLLENPKAQGATQAKILEDKTMGNQQATREEIGWLAGIIDGEGYLGMRAQIDKRTKRRQPTITPSLHISNTDEAIILKCQNIMRKMGVNPYIRATKANSRVKKDQFHVQIARMAKAQTILNAVLPWLTGEKKKRAELIVEFIGIRKKTPWIWIAPNNPTNQAGALKPYGQREWEIFQECKVFQTRGASETERRARRMTSEIWKLMESRQLEAAKIQSALT